MKHKDTQKHTLETEAVLQAQVGLHYRIQTHRLRQTLKHTGIPDRQRERERERERKREREREKERGREGGRGRKDQRRGEEM